MPACACMHLHNWVKIYKETHTHIYIYIYIYLSIYPSIYLSIYLINLSIYLSIHLSIYIEYRYTVRDRGREKQDREREREVCGIPGYLGLKRGKGCKDAKVYSNRSKGQLFAASAYLFMIWMKPQAFKPPKRGNSHSMPSIHNLRPVPSFLSQAEVGRHLLQIIRTDP